MNINVHVNWPYFYPDTSSSESDSSDFDDTSTSGIRDSSNSSQTDENSKELQRWLDSNKPSDKEKLNAKIIDIVRQDNKVLFMYLIANNYKLEALNNKGQTALHLASNFGENILSLIVDFPNYITENHTDCNGFNYLHIASFIGHDELARRCLKVGADVNARFHTDPTGLRSNFTPLHYAANTMLDQSRKVMKLLLKNGADINAVDYKGRTPLHIACRIYDVLFVSHDKLDSYNSSKLVKILMENGSDPDARDNNGNTALLSIVHDYYNEWCFEESEDSNSLPSVEIHRKLKYFLKKNVDFLATDNDGNNILHRIIENLKLSRYRIDESVDFSYDDEYAKMIKRILRANTGIDVNAKNCFGDTPLQLAVSLMSLDIVKVLLEHKADLSSLTFSQDDQYCFCCCNELPNLDVVQRVIGIIKLLLKEGWKLTFQDNLMLMKLLVHDVDICQCANNLKYKFRSTCSNLIYYSSVQHFEKVVNKVMNDTQLKERFFHGIHFFLEEISTGLYYRKIFNFYEDKEILHILKKKLSKQSNFDESKSSLKRDDVVRMKYTKMNNGMTLYDVMTRHPHQIYGYIKNQNFDKITEHFAQWEDAVKGHVAKSLVRHHIEKMAVEYLRILLFPSFPVVCCKLILDFLTNAEIVNMCSAALLEKE